MNIIPKHTNSKIYIISLLIPVILTVILVTLQLIAIAFDNGNNQNAAFLYLAIAMNLAVFFILFMLIPLTAYSILYLIQIYRMWDVINDGHSRATPGKALGFLFIPFFNIYWGFNVWGGFPTDYNAFVNRYRLNDKVPLLNPTVYQIFPVLILLSGLIITIPVLLIYFAVLLNKSNVAIDDLKTAIAGSQQQFYQRQPANMTFQPQV